MPARYSVHTVYTKVNYEDVEKVSEAMHFLRDPLDTQRVGVTVVRCEPGWIGQPHDHAADDHEEVYVLVTGRATVRVEDEEIPMRSGDAISISPAATRQIVNGDAESAFVLVSAPTDLGDPDDDGDDPRILTGFPG